MKQLVAFLRTAIAHPKSSAMGIAGIAGAVTSMLHDHAQVANPATWTALLLGVGLLFTGDAQPPAAA